MDDGGYQRKETGRGHPPLRQWLWLFFALFVTLVPGIANAQTVNQYTTTTSGVIADNNCGAASQIVRTFTVPTSYIVADVDLGVLVTHTYRSDLRITLTSPQGTSVTVMTWSGNVQSGDNLNDRFDDEAAAAISTHNATGNDSTTATLPDYQHQYRPSNPLSVFDGQNAQGNWTLVVCDAVAVDSGTFQRADLFITDTKLTVTKTSSLIRDPVNDVSNPKAIPGALVRYCVLLTNSGGIAHTAIVMKDNPPIQTSYVPGSMRSGTSCAAATVVEDDDASGADESDPAGMSISGPTLTGTLSSLAAGASFAFTFDVLLN